MLFGTSTISFAQENKVRDSKIKVYDFNSYAEAKKLIDNFKNEPKVIYTESSCVINVSDNSIGTKSMSENFEHADGLKVKYTVSGEFDRDLSGKPYWTKGISSNISEISNKGYLKLGNINSSSVEVCSNDRTCLKMLHDYDLEQYIIVVGKWFHIGTQTCKGTEYFYIK